MVTGGDFLLGIDSLSITRAANFEATFEAMGDFHCLSTTLSGTSTAAAGFTLNVDSDTVVLDPDYCQVAGAVVAWAAAPARSLSPKTR